MLHWWTSGKMLLPARIWAGGSKLSYWVILSVNPSWKGGMYIIWRIVPESVISSYVMVTRCCNVYGGSIRESVIEGKLDRIPGIECYCKLSGMQSYWTLEDSRSIILQTIEAVSSSAHFCANVSAAGSGRFPIGSMGGDGVSCCFLNDTLRKTLLLCYNPNW